MLSFKVYKWMFICLAVYLLIFYEHGQFGLLLLQGILQWIGSELHAGLMHVIQGN